MIDSRFANDIDSKYSVVFYTGILQYLYLMNHRYFFLENPLHVSTLAYNTKLLRSIHSEVITIILSFGFTIILSLFESFVNQCVRRNKIKRKLYRNDSMSVNAKHTYYSAQAFVNSSWAHLNTFPVVYHWCRKYIWFLVYYNIKYLPYSRIWVTSLGFPLT